MIAGRGLFNPRVSHEGKDRLASEVHQDPSDIADVGRESDLVVIHVVLFPGLIFDDCSEHLVIGLALAIAENVDGRFGIVLGPAIENGDSQYGCMRALSLLVQHGNLSVSLLPTVRLERVGLIVDVVRRATVSFVVAWHPLAPVKDVVGGNVEQGEAVGPGQTSEVCGHCCVDLE